MKLISVIIPIYNVEQYLPRCIESVRNQTYQKIEIILIDDGSTDRSSEICDKYAGEDSRIKVIHKSNGGLSSARNSGLKCAQGEYVFFVDADDFIDKKTFSVLQEKLELYQADMAICEYLFVDELGNSLEDDKKDTEGETILTGQQLLIQNTMGNIESSIVAWNKLYRRSIFAEVMFAEGKQHEDEFIFHEICNQCARIVSVKKALYFYTQRSDSIMGKGISVKSIDAIEAYIKRISYMNTIKEPQMKIACEKAIDQLYCLAYRYGKELGSDNYELNRKMRQLCKEVVAFIPILLGDSSKNIKEKLQFVVWLFSPKLFGKIWRDYRR